MAMVLSYVRQRHTQSPEPLSAADRATTCQIRWLLPRPEGSGRSALGHRSRAFVSGFSVPYRYTAVTEAGCV